MNCPKCGSEVNENQKFCSFCGTNIAKSKNKNNIIYTFTKNIHNIFLIIFCTISLINIVLLTGTLFSCDTFNIIKSIYNFINIIPFPYGNEHLITFFYMILIEYSVFVCINSVLLFKIKKVWNNNFYGYLFIFNILSLFVISNSYLIKLLSIEIPIYEAVQKSTYEIFSVGFFIQLIFIIFFSVMFLGIKNRKAKS